MKQTKLVIFIWIITLKICAQQRMEVLNFQEYLGYVKRFHPVAKQAGLKIKSATALLMKTRGAFDPVLKLKYDRKAFKEKEYYDLLNSVLKVPLWYGVDLQAGYEKSAGVFLNPQNTLPDEGLFNLGITASVGKGLWINERRASLKKAKLFGQQTQADQQLMVNKVLYQAILAYFDWVLRYSETKVYERFIENAKIRLDGVTQSTLLGEKAGIDTIEARIIYQNRKLKYTQSQLKYNKSALQLANFLWIEGDIPAELQAHVVPDRNVNTDIDRVLNLVGKMWEGYSVVNHPKIRSLGYKIKSLEVDRRLKQNKLLPDFSLKYNFLTSTPTQLNSLELQQYKGGISFKFPLFLRTERGDLRLNQLKILDTKYQRQLTQISLQNKIEGVFVALRSLETQSKMIQGIVADYEKLVQAEERKFGFGESSLFLINSREKNWIYSQLQQLKIENEWRSAKAELFYQLATQL